MVLYQAGENVIYLILFIIFMIGFYALQHHYVDVAFDYALAFVDNIRELYQRVKS